METSDGVAQDADVDAGDAGSGGTPIDIDKMTRARRQSLSLSLLFKSDPWTEAGEGCQVVLNSNLCARLTTNLISLMASLYILSLIHI